MICIRCNNKLSVRYELTGVSYHCNDKKCNERWWRSGPTTSFVIIDFTQSDFAYRLSFASDNSEYCAVGIRSNTRQSYTVGTHIADFGGYVSADVYPLQGKISLPFFDFVSIEQYAERAEKLKHTVQKCLLLR